MCDHSRKFIYTFIGWPGSVHDATAYNRSELAQSPQTFFSRGEYLLADKAFKCTPSVIPPFKKPAANKRQNKEFNRRLSSIRIDIEHSFGSLKSRWQSLRDMRIRIVDEKSYEYAVKWITACVVLHNFLLSLDDPEWEEEEPDEPEEERENEARKGADDDTDGKRRRKEVRDRVLYGD